VVRGAAAVLSAPAGAALVWAAPVLPGLGDGDVATLVPGVVALLAVAACALLPAPAVEARGLLWVALPALAVLVAALAVAGAAGSATPVEALAFGCLGVALAAFLDAPALALALPLFAAAVELAGLVGGAPGGLRLGTAMGDGEPLDLTLPAWGEAGAVGQVGAADVVLLAWYATYARRFGLRPRVTALALAAALAASLVLAVATDGRVPVLALLGAAYLVANGDRLGGLLRAARAG
jgi:hypothetical protein